MRSTTTRSPARSARVLVAGLVLALATTVATAHGQQVDLLAETVTVELGKTTLIESPRPLQRVSIAESSIAEAVVVSRNEVLVNGKQIGSTSLLLWTTEGQRRLYTLQVTADAATLEHNLRQLFPDEPIEVTANREAFVLSGQVSEARVAQRAVAIAEATGAPVVNNMEVPAPKQILLQVRFAEVSRNALNALSVNFARVDPFNIRGDDEGFIGTGTTPPGGNFINNPPGPDQTFSDAVNFYLFHEDESIATFIRALKSEGLFRSLAEPNLLALDGQEASFLAGGEFPFPVLQGSGTGQSITVTFKEFGIRLNFTPTVTNSGNISLKVAPEVSQLDFANGLTLSGFQIPAVLARRAETTVELQDGQTFAIAGLIDNSITENVDKIPILGDIPILGALFRSTELRQDRSELLVLVTPHLVEPSDAAPPVPTGEPDTWDWEKSLEEPVGQQTPGGR